MNKYFNSILATNLIVAIITIIITSAGIHYYNTNSTKYKGDPKNQSDYNQMIAYLVLACLYFLFSVVILIFQLHIGLLFILLTILMLVISFLSVACTNDYLNGGILSLIPLIICAGADIILFFESLSED